MNRGRKSETIDDISVDDYRNVTEGYLKRVHFKRVFLIFLGVLCIALTLVAIRLGAANLTYGDIIRTLIYRDDILNMHFVTARLTRASAAILCGAALGVSGVVMQGILRNPMASPFTLGTSGAAAFGAAVGILFLSGGSIATAIMDSPYIITLSAFLFSLIATGIILLLIKIVDATPETIILAGIAVGAIFTAGLSFLQYFADETALTAIVFWQFGDLSKITVQGLKILAVITLVCSVYFFWKRWDYNAMESGDELAKGLGVNTERTRVVGLVLAALVAAVTVSFMGVIGFIGLVAPHMVKRIIGNDFRYTLAGSMLMGATVMLIAHIFASHVFPYFVGNSLPVGIVTSLIGGPVFISILIGRRRASA
ncbi:MAG: FecCD family ABC transporter permease [Candidatus Methanomethylophilaceae archaeon]|jgi:iron complex transport system permease protein